MVRTLDADRNAELERRYSVSYGNDRGNRKNMQTGRSSGAAKNTRGTQTARRRKDTDVAGAVGTSRTTGTTSAICGWVDAESETNYECELSMYNHT